MDTVRELLKGKIIHAHPDAIETASGESSVFTIPSMGGTDFAAIIHITSVHGTTAHLSAHLVNRDPITQLEDSILIFTRNTAVGAEWKYALESGKQFGNQVKLKWALDGSAVPKIGFVVVLHMKPI
jgi:hypothetical protein